MPSIGRAGHSENVSRSRRQSGCHSGDEEGVRFVPGGSLGATLETRRECVSFQVTVWVPLWRRGEAVPESPRHV